MDVVVKKEKKESKELIYEGQMIIIITFIYIQ